jgi:hypothetical protein
MYRVASSPDATNRGIAKSKFSSPTAKAAMAVGTSLAKSTDAVEREIGKRLLEAVLDRRGTPHARSMLLGAAVAASAEGGPTGSKALAELGADFAISFADELHRLVCRGEGRKTMMTQDATAASLAALMAAQLGITNSVALGLATFLLFCVVRATHGAFCSATKQQLRKLLLSQKKSKTVGRKTLSKKGA